MLRILRRGWPHFDASDMGNGVVGPWYISVNLHKLRRAWVSRNWGGTHKFIVILQLGGNTNL